MFEWCPELVLPPARLQAKSHPAKLCLWVSQVILWLAALKWLSVELRFWTEYVGSEVRWGVGFNLWVAQLPWWVASNFRVPDGVGESGVRPRRSLRQMRAKQENEDAKLIFELANYILQLEYLYRERHKHIRSYFGECTVVKWTYYKKDCTPMNAKECWLKSSENLVVTQTHDLKNWCVRGVIGLQHGTCVELVGL